MTVERRLALEHALSDRGVAGALVTDAVNVRYLTGFTGSNSALIIPMGGEAVLVTDGRYRDQAAIEAPDVRINVARDVLASSAQAMQHGRWAIETGHLSVDAYDRLRAAAPGAELVSATNAVESLREVKDDQECEALRDACDISTRALEDLLSENLIGRSERTIARDLQWRMYKWGADGIAFDSIVAAGENAAVPHHAPTERTLQRGDLLKIDFGAVLAGYHADCTRTMVAGPAAGWQREIYDAVLASQVAGLNAVTAGADIADVWNAALQVLQQAGWADYFTTGLGHGVGLRIHEDPFIGPRHDGKLAEHMTVTVEPGVYLTGSGGVRIEDTVVVTGGEAQLLTTMTKDLVEI